MKDKVDIFMEEYKRRSELSYNKLSDELHKAQLDKTLPTAVRALMLEASIRLFPKSFKV